MNEEQEWVRGDVTLRIDGKPLRYAMETYASCFGPGYRRCFGEVKEMLEQVRQTPDGLTAIAFKVSAFTKAVWPAGSEMGVSHSNRPARAPSRGDTSRNPCAASRAGPIGPKTSVTPLIHHAYNSWL